MPRPNLPAAAAVVLLLVVPGRAAADSYRDDQHGYALDLPAGWQVMPAGELRQANEFARQRSRGEAEVVQYRAGFRPRGTRPGALPAYALVQYHPEETAGKAAEDIAREYNREMGAGEVKRFRAKTSDVLSDMAFGSVGFDAARNWVLLRMTATGRDGRRLEGLSVGHVGPAGVVFVTTYFDLPGGPRWPRRSSG